MQRGFSKSCNGMLPQSGTMNTTGCVVADVQIQQLLGPSSCTKGLDAHDDDVEPRWKKAQLYVA